MDEKNKVYVKINTARYITAVNSDEFISNLTGWIKIDEGSGGKYMHAQTRYFEKPLKTDGGAYQYRLNDNNKPRESTPEEIAAQEEANKPTPAPSGNLEERVAAVESDVADLTAAIKKGLSL